MKAAVRLKYVLIFFCCTSTFFTPGCSQEGCTDKAALNYNSVASKDDGSCIYCQKSTVQNEFSLDIQESNFSSTYYGQIVARAHVMHKVAGYQYDDCGDQDCGVYFEIENLINRRIAFYCYISFSNFTTFSNYVDLQAHQTSQRDSLVSSGSFSSICNAQQQNASVVLNSDIIYF